MDSKQTKIVLGVFAFVLFACLISPLLFSMREPDRVPGAMSLSFNASRAYAATAEFVRLFPNRAFGSLESRQSTGFLHERLVSLGYDVSYTHFDARISRRSQVGRNVLAFKQGQSSEILAVIAHLDSSRTTLQGAAENGSGVGVLLELARVFAANPTHRSLLLIFSDGGEWGSVGAKDVAENHQQRDKIAAVISLDHVTSGDLAAFCLEGTGQLNGFAPAWLRQMARDAAKAQGLPVSDVFGIREHFERAILISAADQGPFLRVGIPAINLGSISTDEVNDRARHHSPQDTIDHLKMGSFAKYGNAAEQMVRSLDVLKEIPTEAPGAFKLWGSLYLKPMVAPALHIIAFLPFILIFGFHLRNHRGRLNAIGVAREVLVSLGTALPFLSLLFSIGLARALRSIPLYSLYPPSAKDTVLANPPWNVLGIILCAAIFLALFFYIIGKYSIRELPKPDFHASKQVLLALMLILVFLAYLKNSYWATAFLLLPAWIWALVGHAQTRTKQVRNGLLILAAGIPYYAALAFYSSRLEMSWNFIWYQVLAFSSGLFATSSCFMGIAAVVLGIRFLVIQFRDMQPDNS
jgi:hypothetical protein